MIERIGRDRASAIAAWNLRAAAPKEWRCFHCDEVFTDEAAAREHFGSYGPRILSEPACQIDAAEYRAMEQRMADYNAEDADIHRQMARMECEHKTALRREEEKGYARGVADQRKEFQALGYVSVSEVVHVRGGGRGTVFPGSNQAATVAVYIDADALRTAEYADDGCDEAWQKMRADAARRQACWCAACRPITLADMRFIVCPTCGNKRCPRATSCAYKCSGSNDLNQTPELA
jgi:hypothetical protein